jgi:hypothetical protein
MLEHSSWLSVETFSDDVTAAWIATFIPPMVPRVFQDSHGQNHSTIPAFNNNMLEVR